MKKLTTDIVIIDTGVDTNYKNSKIKGISIGENLKIKDKFEDEIGHGTAITDIILRHSQTAHIFMIKIFTAKKKFINEKKLITALEFILENIECKIINMSLGITFIEDKEKLYTICQKLIKKDIIILSSFENTNGISYPAAFNNVIGVTSDDECININDFFVTNSNIVNIGAFGKNQRIKWLDNKIKLGEGNSLACAHMTGIIYNIIQNKKISQRNLMKILKLNALDRNKFLKFNIPKKLNKKPPIELYKKVIIFPFNKEMHSLVMFEKLLPFQIIDIYDIKYSGNVGASTSTILKASKVTKNFIIKNIENINWENFDTIILGHTKKLQNFIEDANFIFNLIKKALDKNKYVYSLDEIFINSNKIYFPKIDDKSFLKIPYGKLYRFSKPILAIFGTSSNQGKHTLQLELKERFQTCNYKIGHLGTEPTDFLFQAEECFHFGYDSKIKLNEYDKIKCINYMLHKIDQIKDIDIILTGCQSGTITEEFGNISFYTINQNIFLHAIIPDAIILMINPDDNNILIKRTIKYIENAIDCKVIALVVYPMKYINLNQNLRKRKINIEEFEKIKIKLSKFFNKPIYFLDNEKSIDELFSTIINFFTD